MSIADKHIYNRYFEEIQRKIKAKNPEGVIADFQRVSEMVLNHTLAPIHYYYLLNGVDPNEWLSPEKGYKRYKKPEDSPLFWLRKFRQDSTTTLADVAMARMNEVQSEVKSKIDKEYQEKKRISDELKRLEDEELSKRSVVGTPFDLSWKIRPPRKERG